MSFVVKVSKFKLSVAVDVYLSPLLPLEPDEPDEPELPLIPDVPLTPDVPEVPEAPTAPITSKVTIPELTCFTFMVLPKLIWVTFEFEVE